MTKAELIQLAELRRLLQMETFSAANYQPVTIRTSEGATEFVREQTKLWRETWILPVLSELIDKHKHKFRAIE